VLQAYFDLKAMDSAAAGTGTDTGTNP